MPTVQFKDYYKTLGLKRAATPAEIKTAYRTLAKQYHPDKNPGDRAAEERFKEINEANEVLIDPEKRKLYDRYGDAWRQYKDAGFTGDEPRGRSSVSSDDFATWFQQQGGTAQPGGFGTYRTEYRTPTNGGGFSDFFQTLFGGFGGHSGREAPPRAQPTSQRGANLDVGITISFDEAYNGSTRTFEVQSDGVCPTCDGRGLVRENPCPTCDGSGHAAQTRLIEVKIPTGVSTGSKIRIKGQGNPGLGGGPNGDILINVTVQPDPRFERAGDDLRTEIDVPLYIAILGGEVVVPTPTGRIALTIPAETQAGRVFRIRGRGLPRLKDKGAGDRGDLLARARILIPTTLTDAERDLFRQLRDFRDEPATS